MFLSISVPLQLSLFITYKTASFINWNHQNFRVFHYVSIVKVIWLTFSYLNKAVLYIYGILHFSLVFPPKFTNHSLFTWWPFSHIFGLVFSPSLYRAKARKILVQKQPPKKKKSLRGQIKSVLQTYHFSHTSHKNIFQQGSQPLRTSIHTKSLSYPASPQTHCHTGRPGRTVLNVRFQTFTDTEIN